MDEPDLFFEPWVGEDYGRTPYDHGAVERSGTYPLHVLGESHYTDEPTRDPGFTRRVIETYGSSPSRSPFFRNLLKTLTGKDVMTADEVRSVWRNLAFSNYVQDFLPGPRIAPTAAMWARGRLAFDDLLQRYRPDTILILGQRLWRAMDKGDGFRLAPLHDDDVTVDDARILRYRVDGQERWVVAMHILHPSAPAFDFRKARLRVGLLRQWQDNLDTTGHMLPFVEQRERIEAASAQ